MGTHKVNYYTRVKDEIARAMSRVYVSVIT